MVVAWAPGVAEARRLTSLLGGETAVAGLTCRWWRVTGVVGAQLSRQGQLSADREPLSIATLRPTAATPSAVSLPKTSHLLISLVTRVDELLTPGQHFR